MKINFFKNGTVERLLNEFEYAMYFKVVYDEQDENFKDCKIMTLHSNKIDFYIDLLIYKDCLVCKVSDYAKPKEDRILEYKKYKRIDYFINYVNKIYKKYN